MNKEFIDNLQIGREADKLIAEHIFGWHTFESSDIKFTILMEPCCKVCGKIKQFNSPKRHYIKHLDNVNFPFYSTSLSGAFEIIDEILKSGWALSEISSNDGSKWSAILELRSDEVAVVSTAETLPLAICKAGLKWKLGITV